jgi:RNA 2',3'-cyclic 3'-phosphodiesterase
MARLFFALWPPDAARAALSRLALDAAERSGGRPVAAAKIHLTLAFLGDVPAERAGAALNAADRVAGEGFIAEFDRLGTFGRAGVAWVAPSRPPPQLEALAAALAGQLRESGFVLEERAFAAHVTLARRIRRKVDGALPEPVAWDANAFALVESDLRTGRYETRGRWILGTR